MNNKSIHFIGIGGIGMSGIAELCLKKGYRVSGSDISDSENMQKLNKLGAQVCVGHKTSNVKGKDMVVYSSAIVSANCELEEANRLRIKVLKRAQALAFLMNSHLVITVTGAHGKTTTSSLAGHLLNTANFSPTIAVGGIVGNTASNAELGSGRYFVAEADESDGTFLYYKPKYSIITNIDREHLDFYGTFENVKKCFKKFVLNTEKDGCVFWCYDDLELRNIIKDSKVSNLSFGLDKHAAIHATNIELNPTGSEFDVFYNKKLLDRFKLSIPGLHNVSNSLSVIALGLSLRVDIGLIKKSLETFKGVKRRFQIKHNHDDVLIIDDYAHHPNEIAATIKTGKLLGRKRIVVVFQPHRYTRLKSLLEQFTKCFSDAHHLFITDIYSAGETKIEGVDSNKLYELMRNSQSPKTDLLAKSEIVGSISNFIKKGDLVFFLGAGDINKISDELVKELKRKSKV